MHYEAGDVVWGPDPYHSSDPFLDQGRARPWLILSTVAYPRHGSDYICCAVTSTGRQDSSFIALRADDWEVGRLPKASSIDPQTLMVLKAAWIEHAVGRLAPAKVERAQEAVRGYLGP